MCRHIRCHHHNPGLRLLIPEPGDSIRLEKPEDGLSSALGEYGFSGYFCKLTSAVHNAQALASTVLCTTR